MIIRDSATKYLVVLLLIGLLNPNAQAFIDTSVPGKVTVEKPQDVSLPYKQRRSTHGFVFAVHRENFYPLDYQSQFGDVYVEGIIGKDTIPLVGLDIGYKYNVSIGSISAIYNFSQGSIDGSVLARTISLQRQQLAANVALDALFDEPYVVPYLQLGVHQFTASEDDGTTTQSAVTNYSFNYRYGLQFQIDWLESLIDPSAKAERLLSSGMENLFLDIYFVDHMASSGAQDPLVLGSEGEPNLVSGGEMGLGLRLEF